MRIFFTLFLICSLAKMVHGQANVYHPFPDSNATWAQAFTYSSPPLQGWLEYNIKGADTVVNATTYNLVMVAGSPNPMAGMRQDIPNKKVYAVFFSTPMSSMYELNKEYLIYDFSLSVGDTLPDRLFNFYLDTVSYVCAIDSILIGGQYRQRMHFKGSWNKYDSIPVIQGIGSIFGLFEYKYGFEDASALCQFYDSSVSYSTHACFKDILAVSPGNRVTIFPNPVYTEATLNTNQLVENGSVVICNAFGQEAKRIEGIRENKIKITTDHLPQGVYLVTLIEKNKLIAREKLIIVR